MNRSGIHAGLQASRPRQGRFVWTVVLVAMAMSASRVQTARAQCEAWAPLGTGMDNAIEALTTLPNGDLVAGGFFTTAGGVATSNIARWDGTNWSALGMGMNGGVISLTTLPNGDLVAGGGFDMAGGVAANNIARWDGTSWSALGMGTDSFVTALTTLPNGDLVAGGNFTMAGGVAANYIGRWDGTNWSPLGTGMNLIIRAATTLPNGDLVAGGSFTMAGGVAANRIARWDGTNWSALGTGMPDTVWELTTLLNGDLIAGGSFTTAGGTAASRIARWDGTNWSALGTGVNSNLNSLTTLPNGDLIAGGLFTVAGGVNTNFIARWDGTTWSPLGMGTNGLVTSLTTLQNGELVAGGFFTMAGDVPANRIARFQPLIDLAITKTDGQTVAAPGQTVTYTITVTNNAMCEATGATVVDMFPPGLTAVTYTSVVTDGATGNTAMGNGDINDIVTMPAGSTITYTAIGTLMPGATGTLDNTATVTAPAGVVDPDLTNNTATDSDAFLSLPVFTKFFTPDPATPGQIVTLVFTITNTASPLGVTDLDFTDNLPAGLVATGTASTTCTGGTLTAAGSTISYSGSSVAAGASCTINASVLVPSNAVPGTAYVNTTGDLTGTMNGVNINSGTATDMLFVDTGRADLSMTKTDGQTNAVPGQPVIYTIVVANAGPSDATGATVVDMFPPNMTAVTYTSISTGGATGNTAMGNGDINDIVTMPAGSTITYTATGTVMPGAIGMLDNTATVTPPAGVFDPDLTNNTATDSDLIDTDGDGTADVNDGCPNDATKIVPGVCGCGTADTDTDNDGTPDCNDGCPNDATKIAAGVCGCGNAETDANNNGVADCIDPTIGPCPNNITVQATSDAGIPVDFMLPAGNSPIGNVVVTSNPPTGSTLPVGTTTVTVTATDDNNVTATCAFDVIVTPPAAPAPQPTTPACNQPLQLLISIFFRAPICGTGACAAMMMTIIGLMGIKRTVRRRRRQTI